MSGTLSIAVAAYTLTALALTFVAGLAWWRSRRTRMALLGTGFGWFAVGGIVASYGIFRGFAVVDLLTWQVVLSALGLVTIYLAAVKR
ncbi:MAG: hypothetical protein KY455_10310 [Euryarchaeota archaeon]|nr:hypothetical protein [Euryarchaeota archaeon]